MVDMGNKKIFRTISFANLVTALVVLLSVATSTSAAASSKEQQMPFRMDSHKIDNEQTMNSDSFKHRDSFSYLIATTPIPIDQHWEVLGPFPTGMREQDFGADPLEAFGGFLKLPFDYDAAYPSELAEGGLVRWHKSKTNEDGWVNILYPEIDWNFNQLFYGWGINQFQAWARSSFMVPATIEGDKRDGLCSVTIQCENVGDFFVDQDRLAGDWYAYGLTRHTLRLAPGSSHTLSVRVVHEVRIFGGVVLPPPVKVKCELSAAISVASEDVSDPSELPFLQQPMVQVVKEGHGGYVVMDVVDDVLAGEIISVALRNIGPDPVLVKGVRVLQGSHQFSANLDADPMTAPISIYPGTHRPIALRLSKSTIDSAAEVDENTTLQFSLEFELESIDLHGISYQQHGELRSRKRNLETDSITLKRTTWGEPYKYTFRDFDGVVNYAAAIPPSSPQSATGSAPVIVALHGAGVEVALSDFWLTEYKQRERTWIILPTGRSSWGYDWHGASIKNVMNAVLSLRDYLPGVPQALRDLHGMQPDADRILMAGHSNGGQGAWYWATHFPDLAIAVTPAAGYVNIKQYVSYSGWLSNSHTDSHLRGLLESSITEYDNDVHISNVVGIPIMARTGSVDNNVPPLNSRKMVRLVQENAHNMSSSKLSEIHGEGHWFVGVLHDEIMQEFLRTHLGDDTVSSASASTQNKEVVPPPLPKSFEINLVNPAGMGSRAGILVEQLRIPYRKGTIKVEIIDNPTEEPDSSSPTTSWVLKSTNIRRFRFVDSTAMRKRMTGSSVSQFVLDGVRFYLGEETGQISMSDLAQGTFLRSSGSQGQKELWKFSNSEDWLHTERHRETYGPAIQILEKRVIVVLGTAFDHDSSKELSKAADRIAKLIAHDIFLYGRGDVAVMTDREYQETILLRSDQQEPVLNKANLILIGDAHQNSVAKHVLEQRASEVTIDTTKGLISVQPSGSSVDMETETEFREPGTGLLMIRPWGPSNLAMIIAGLDVQGLDMASRLFPKRTGLLVPDWIVTGSEMHWKGAGGVLAAGYWGNQWEYQLSMSA